MLSEIECKFANRLGRVFTSAGEMASVRVCLWVWLGVGLSARMVAPPLPPLSVHAPQISAVLRETRSREPQIEYTALHTTADSAPESAEASSLLRALGEWMVRDMQSHE